MKKMKRAVNCAVHINLKSSKSKNNLKPKKNTPSDCPNPKRQVPQMQKGGLSRSKSQVRLHQNKLQRSQSTLQRNTERTDYDQKEYILNYIESIEKNVTELKSCLSNLKPHSSKPTIIPPKTKTKKTLAKNRTITGKQNSKSVSNLQTITSSYRPNTNRNLIGVNTKNCKPKKKFSTDSIKRNELSIKDIRLIYQKRFGKQTNNIVELYEFYKCLKQQQEQKREYHNDNCGQDYLLKIDSSTEEIKQCRPQKYNARFVIDIESLQTPLQDQEQEQRVSTNSVATEYSKPHNKQVTIKESIILNSLDMAGGLQPKGGLPTHFKRSQNRLEQSKSFVRENNQKIKELFIAEQDYLQLQQSQGDILDHILDEKQIVKKLSWGAQLDFLNKQRNQNETNSLNRVNKMVSPVQSTKQNEDPVNRYIKQCINFNDQLSKKKKLSLTKGVLFTDMNLNQLSDTEQQQWDVVHRTSRDNYSSPISEGENGQHRCTNQSGQFILENDISL